MASNSPTACPLHRPLVGALFAWAESAADSPALFLPQDGATPHKTWREIADDVLRMTAYLNQRGVRPGDRVALWSDNRYEWIVIDQAIQALRAINVPLHSSLPAAGAAAQIEHADAEFVLAATVALADALCRQPIAMRLSRESIELIDAADGQPSLLDRIADCSRDEGKSLYQREAARFDPEAIATILYSSGTTGEPKGVALSHANLITNAYGVVELLEEKPSQRRLNFLPFSHIFARTCDIYTWLAGGSQLVLARSRETVVADCQATAPTLINGVPFFFQRIAQQVAESEAAGAPVTIDHLLGGNLWACICGGAPLPVDVFDFYQERGVMLLPGYGLTESSPVITVGTPNAFRRGAVGKALSGIEVRIAEDGELLTRGPHVMKEYWKDPELTLQTVRDGWLYTGDLGAIDADGFISVTGRKKELIALSTGKKAVPTFIEGTLLREPLILQAMVVGNDRPCLAALVVPNFDLLRSWAQEQRLADLSNGELIRHPTVAQHYARRIAELLGSLPTYEQVKRLTLLDRAFTIEEGHLTPKLSLRRDALNRDFGKEIAAMYDGGGVAVQYESGPSRMPSGDNKCDSA